MMLMHKTFRPVAVATPSAARHRSVAAHAAPTASKYVIHEIPNNGVWPTGVPPVMGAHLMASMTVAPISTSKGAGIDVYPPKVAYHGLDSNMQTILHATTAAVGTTLGKIVAEASEASIKAKGSFTLVLSGGELINTLPALLAHKPTLQWDKFWIFFVDERNVPHTHEDSNFRQAREALLGKVNIRSTQVFPILENASAREAAVHYEGRLIGLQSSVLPRNAAGFPIFDMLLLGVGKDGHIASLFPHRSHLAETTRWVVPVENSPKPPAARITMTLPVINAAKDVVFVAMGQEKSEVVQRVLEVQALPGSLPAQLVRLPEGRVRWLLDVQSAQGLDIAAWEDSKMFPRSQ